MVARCLCFLWALSAALCAAPLVVTTAAGRLVAEAQGSQPPPSPPASVPKVQSSTGTEASGGSTSAPPSGGAGTVAGSTPHDHSSTNHTQLNQPPPPTPPHGSLIQSPPPLTSSTPGEPSLTSKDPSKTPAPPILSPPPPSVPDPHVQVSASPPPTGKQEQPPTGPRSEAPRSQNVGTKDENGDKKGDGSAGWTTVGYEDVDKCSGTRFKCTFQLDGCIILPQNDNKGLLLYVRNTGESSKNVIVMIPPSTEIDLKGLPKHGARQIPISIDSKDIPTIAILTDQKTCSPFSEGASTNDLITQFQFYTSQMTPIYGAYAFFLTALIAGGVWACCSFARKRRRRDSGVPYQQLEMGGIQSLPTVVADTTIDNTADGWEQGWDDDWDDEESLSRPQGSGNPSSNGLTSKSTNKDGWDDWDD